MKTSWSSADFVEVVADVSAGRPKTKQNDYLEWGRYPIVDQGKALVGGYTDDVSLLAEVELPVIVFGDHTRCLKFIDFPFGCGADGTKVLKPRAGLDPKYLYRYLQTVDLTDAGYSRHYKFLKKVQIPLPPLEEQQRVAAILDAADQLRTKRRQALAKLDTLTQAIFIDMFGDPARPEPSGPVIQLGELCEMDNGLNFTSAERGDGTTGVLVLDVKNMYTPGIEPDVGSAYRVDIDIPSRRLLEPGDLLFVRSSVKREGVAWPAYFAGHTEPAAFCGFIIRGRLHEEQAHNFTPEYLVHFLRQPAVRLRAVASSGQVAITNVSQKRLGELLVPIASVQSQLEFRDRLTRIEKLRIDETSTLAELESLFGSLQQRAFRGEL
ncbi:restriction endonuclease subunit S [Acidimicrobiales bacterium]|nr:restriction endonuclease subunit S [Acidimicrobiales bacterium]